MSGQIVYGQALFEGGEFAEARTVFENALAMDRENLIALKHLGDLALRNGETGAARQFYLKLLEIDPQDAKVIAIVNEMDAAAEAQPALAEAPPASEESEAAPVAAEGPAAPVAESTRQDEEDALVSAELGFPVPPPQAFVTETMAELYYAQGFRDRAANVYRQLLELRPDDERLRSRLLQIEDTGEDAPVEARREEQPSVESPEQTPEPDRTPSIESPAPPAEVETPFEDSVDGDSSRVDSPPPEVHEREADSVEAPAPEELGAEPDFIPPQLTVRDFFAALGRRRPTSRSNGNGSHAAAANFPSGDVFAAAAVNESDARAASARAGAFGGSGTPATSTPTSAVPGKESEEDVASFRAWLDGLTGQ